MRTDRTEEVTVNESGKEQSSECVVLSEQTSAVAHKLPSTHTDPGKGRTAHEADLSQQKKKNVDASRPQERGGSGGGRTLAVEGSSPTTHRQRSSDSLTLSSSYSEGEATSSEGPTPSTAQGSGPGQARAPGAAKPPSSGKKSGKHSKKSKKGKKKDQQAQGKGGEKGGHQRSPASQRRRAHVLQRIRQDSLNTSSDEENSLTPLVDLPSPLLDPTFPVAGEVAGAGAGLVGGASPVKEGVEVWDQERVRGDLQRRILSKKPPAHFETPATDPIFHEVQ